MIVQSRGAHVLEGHRVRSALAFELHGHVWEACFSPYANFVLQKCVTTLEPENVQFVVDEIVQGSVEKVATNKFGCRVIQRLVERCPDEQVAPLVQAVVVQFSTISRHPYGNYVVQHLLEHASLQHRRHLSLLVELDVRGLAADCFGGAVVSGALSGAPAENQVCMARALVKEGALALIACTRHGHTAAIRTLQVLEGAERKAARHILLASKSTLEASRWGSIVLQHL